MPTRIEVIQGDITKLAVDAIVNAANNGLTGGAGVNGAIHRAGGPEIDEECRKVIEKKGQCKTGEAVITKAGNLRAKYVIHTVGPVWHGGGNRETEKLADCYKNSLQLAVENNCKTIAFPGISTGIFGYPKEDAVKIATSVAKEFLQHNQSIDTLIFVCFDDESYRLYKTYSS
jgi:O-acetyl-ADP-ribose deacetylase (regulator of RNase III)